MRIVGRALASVLFASTLTGATVAVASEPAHAATATTVTFCLVHAGGGPYTQQVFLQRSDPVSGAPGAILGVVKGAPRGCQSIYAPTNMYVRVGGLTSVYTGTFWYGTTCWVWTGAGGSVNAGTGYIYYYA